MTKQKRRRGEFTTLLLSVPKDATPALRETARLLGYIVPSGEYAGEGNVSELITHVGAGTIDYQQLAQAQAQAARNLGYSDD